MKVSKFGEGKRSLVIIGGIHGDEPGTAITVKILNNILRETNIYGNIKTIIANEKALKQNKRYIDYDLNRSFNQSGSYGHENKLSHKIINESQNADRVLALHSSKSVPPPFCITNNINSKKKHICALPVSYAVYTENADGSLEYELENTINIELGHQQTNQVIYNGILCVKSIMSSMNIIDNYSINYTDTQVIESNQPLKKTFGEPRVYYNNFEKISYNDIIAEDDGVVHISKEKNLTSVLMSEYGYDDIFGYLGKYKNKLTYN